MPGKGALGERARDELGRFGRLGRHRGLPHQAVDLLNNHVAFDAGVALFVAIYSALQRRPALPALLVLGDMSVQGNIKPMTAPIEALRLGMESGAHRALIPTENKRNLMEVPGDVVDKVDPIFYSDPLTAALKALGMK
jgi:ATP-dependent Lon protease